MKKITLFIVTVLLFASCRYEEGPGISFRSPEYRLIGYWQLLLIEKNGVEYTETDEIANKLGNYYAFFYDGILDVETYQDGIARMSYYGYWAFENNENNVIVDFSLLNKRYTYSAEIKKLSYNSLIYEYTDEDGNSWRLRFSKR